MAERERVQPALPAVPPCVKGDRHVSFQVPAESSSLTCSVFPVTLNPQPRRMLDLFSGTGSVGSVYRAHGFQVTSLDSDPRWNADIVCDVRKWNFRTFPRGFFDVIFASPPCTEYSSSKTTRMRNLAEANSIVRCVLEIIDYFQPTRWMLENPRYGLLHRQAFMQKLKWVDVDFCQFSTFGYRKRTRNWGSPHVAALPDVLCDRITCQNLIPGRRRHRLHLEEEGVTKEEKFTDPQIAHHVSPRLDRWKGGDVPKFSAANGM